MSRQKTADQGAQRGWLGLHEREGEKATRAGVGNKIEASERGAIRWSLSFRIKKVKRTRERHGQQAML